MSWIDENEIVEYHYTEEIYDSAYMALHRQIYDRIDAERYAYLTKKTEIDNNSKYIFLTINPNDRITLLDFINKMNKMMKKKWIMNYLFVFEQRGETLAELGKGFHFHCILEKPKNKKYCEMLRELSNTANTVCDASNYHFFNVKSISEEEKDRKITYITGQKADESKHLKQQMDIIWREQEKLKSYYNVGII